MSQEIDADNATPWDEETDVIVVGFGGAGACAAIEAVDNGAEVIVVDRYEGGGATEASGGVYYGGGTRFQKEAGFEDSADEMFKYLSMEVADVVSPATLRKFCDDSAANLEWLAGHGLPFAADFCADKTSYPGKSVYLYYSGNELNPHFKAQAKPAPRGHRVVGSGATGNIFFQHLRQAALQRGIAPRQHCPVTALLTDGQGAVLGVEVRRLKPGKAYRKHARLYKLGKRLVGIVSPAMARKMLDKAAKIEAGAAPEVKRIRARRGVILASGGYIFNRAMIDQEAPLYTDAAPLGTPGCDGSGIALGRSVGAATAHMDSMCASRSIAPPLPLVKGVAVDASGRRFVPEDAYTATLGRKIAESDGGTAWLILNKKEFKAARRQSLPGNGRLLLIHCVPSLMLLLFGSKKAATLAGLAEKCALPVVALEQTVAEYNMRIESGQPDLLGKKEDYRVKIDQGPYYALDISLRSKVAPLPTISMGGLVIDEDTSGVRREDGSVIKGLYAVGRAAVGLPSHYYLSGLSLADCVFSGRRAGRSAAARKDVAN